MTIWDVCVGCSSSTEKWSQSVANEVDNGWGREIGVAVLGGPDC